MGERRNNLHLAAAAARLQLSQLSDPRPDKCDPARGWAWAGGAGAALDPVTTLSTSQDPEGALML